MEDFEYKDPRLGWKLITISLEELALLDLILEEVYKSAQEEGDKDCSESSAYLMGRIHSTLHKYEGHHSEERITWALDKDTLQSFIFLLSRDLAEHDGEGKRIVDGLRSRLEDYLNRYNSLPENKPA